MRHSNRGFTVIEITVIVVIIGLLVMMAAPLWKSVRENAEAVRFSSDLRTARQTLEMFVTEHGTEVTDAGAGVVPPELDGWMPNGLFNRASAIGGNWIVFNTTADGHSVLNIGVEWADEASQPDHSLLQRIDQGADDGNLSSGNLQMVSANVFAWRID